MKKLDLTKIDFSGKEVENIEIYPETISDRYRYYTSIDIEKEKEKLVRSWFGHTFKTVKEVETYNNVIVQKNKEEWNCIVRSLDDVENEKLITNEEIELYDMGIDLIKLGNKHDNYYEIIILSKIVLTFKNPSSTCIYTFCNDEEGLKFLEYLFKIKLINESDMFFDRLNKKLIGEDIKTIMLEDNE